jgi:hypothetical protein
MKINDFKLERYFADYEFKARHLLSSSDCESVKVTELLQMAPRGKIQVHSRVRISYAEEGFFINFQPYKMFLKLCKNGKGQTCH